MAFSLKHLLLAFVVIAVGLAALLNADLPLLAEFANLLTLVTLIVLGYGIWTTEGDELRVPLRLCWLGRDLFHRHEMVVHCRDIRYLPNARPRQSRHDARKN